MQNKQYILFVSGLDKNVKESDLHKLFTEYPVSYIKIAKDHSTKESYGYAFIGIKNSANKAEEAINKFNYEKMPGYKKTIKVCWYNIDRSATKHKEDLNVFVKNIEKSVTHKEFHDHFAQFGNITSLKIAEDDEGESLGYGFVLYETPEEATKAIELTNGKDFHGKALSSGKFIRNRPKKVAQFNNIFVKNIPIEYSEEKIKSIFSKFGELGSCIFKKANPNQISDKIPEEKKNEILSHQYGFVCFKDPESARKVINEVSFYKLNDSKYNEKVKAIGEVVKGKIEDDNLNRFAVFTIENFDDALNVVSQNTEEVIEKFREIMKEYDGNPNIKDKTDRMICCQALKKSEREKKTKLIFEKIKKNIREKYRLCNLYVKNLPDNFTDKELRDIFEPFGSIRSCKTIKKELVTSYLGIKRSVKVFAYVCYNEKSSAHEAKKALENQQVGGNKLYISYHQTKNERSDYLKLNMINKSQKMKAARIMQPIQMNPNMLRKIPNQGQMLMDLGLYQPNNMELLMNMQQMQIGMMTQMIPYDNVHDMDPNAKRDYYGERLFNKISSNRTYQNFSEFFSKIVGIFLDLEDSVIEKLIGDDIYFETQVRETLRLLAERDNQ